MLQLQIWMTVLSAELRDRFINLAQRRRDQGATTLEYVIIAAAMFAAATGLVVIITKAIRDKQGQIG
jgi:hypothetical protein